MALCDNENQGIVPVPAKIGNGNDPANNLYWGALYGVKTFFRTKAKNWELVKTEKPKSGMVLERVLFKHKTDSVILLAEAYNGARIKNSIQDFLKASNGQGNTEINFQSNIYHFGGSSNLIVYLGHDGLMEFDADVDYQSKPKPKKDAIILACASKDYFEEELKQSGANPLLWTTGLMAPEAYTLEAAIAGWINGETNLQVEERAAQAYHLYQKCGIRGARNLFATGY